MRALAISAAVAGALVLSGCQSTGNNIGGMEYDKSAIGALVGAAAGTVFLKVMQIQARKITVLQPLVQY